MYVNPYGRGCCSLGARILTKSYTMRRLTRIAEGGGKTVHGEPDAVADEGIVGAFPVAA